MSNFELQYTEVSAIRSRTQNAGANLASCATRLRRQASRLNNQSGFGIEQVRASIGAAAGSVSARSQDAYAIASFLSELSASVKEAENAAYSILAGAAPKEISLTDVVVPWTPAFGAGAAWGTLVTALDGAFTPVFNAIADWWAEFTAPHKPTYSLVKTETPGKGTIYERVYTDGRRECISEQGYRVELARGTGSYAQWGRRPGSISKLDYALIADISNKSPEEALQYIKDNFPEDHPLRQAKIVHQSVLGFDYCIFELDSDHAVVSFGGTQDLGDVFADAQLLLGNVNYQSATATELIKSLPYKNIMTTGHSLGGHVAADVALFSDKVTECVVFDAPGRSGVQAITSMFGDGSKIKNYAAMGDIVHLAGIQPGSLEYVDVGPNPDTMGVFGNHSLPDIINAFCADAYSERAS